MAESFTPPAPNASMEENIRFLIQSAVNTNQQLAETKALLTSNQTRLTAAESKINRLESEVKHLKEAVNHREQLARALCIRVINLPVADDEVNGPDPAAATAKLVYERVIRPLLTAAKTKAKISSVPTLPNVISKAFRVAKPISSAPPPPIIVHLLSPTIKSIIFIMKKEAMPRLSDAERAQFQRRLLLSEDLTPPTFAFLKLLKGDERVNRAWTVEGQVRFIKEGDPNNIVHKVRSVYNTVDSLFAA
jgi:hypothetical protein